MTSQNHIVAFAVFVSAMIRKIFFLLILLWPLSVLAQAGAQEKKSFSPYLTRKNTTFTLSSGVRVNDFDWNIASDITGNATPNILSELEWQDVALIEIKQKVKHTRPADFADFDGSLQFEGEITGGVAVDGSVRDSDYLGDNRTIEFSRSDSDANDGFAVGLQAAVGYKFHLQDKGHGGAKHHAPALTGRQPFLTRNQPARRRGSHIYEQSHDNQRINLMPFTGFAWDRQSYWITNGTQTISMFPGIVTPFLGSFENLHSKYTADWYGPFIGMEAELETDTYSLGVRGQYYALEYYGEGIWNLRNDLEQDPSFEHDSSGSGYAFNAAYAYTFDEKYTLTLDGSYKKRKADDGTHTVFFADETNSTIRLNEVNDESYALHMGMKYQW